MRKLIFLFILFLISACGEAPEVILVKKGQLDSCESKTVEQMVDGFMDSARWSNLVADDGNSYVNIKGGITYENKPGEALIQFKILSGGRFQFNALEINDTPQNALVAGILLRAMCGEGLGSSLDQSSSSEEPKTSSALNENTAKADGLTVMSVSDVLLDFRTLIGKRVYVRGFYLFLNEELSFLYEQEGSLTHIIIDAKNLVRADRKILLTQCDGGCTAGFVGVLERRPTGNLLVASKLIK